MSEWYERAIKDEHINSFKYESFKNRKHIVLILKDIDQTIALKSLNKELIDENSFHEFVRENTSVESNPAIERESINSFKYKSFKNRKLISQRGFDSVYSVYSADSEDIGQTVTLKSLGRNLTDEKLYNDFVREYNQFLVFLIDVANEKYFIVLQFANNGDLRSYLQDHFSELNWSTKIEMAKDISNG
ncbi:2188_t:CDS:2, partial [Gigaspora margarita]